MQDDLCSAWREVTLQRRGDPRLLHFNGTAFIRLRDRRIVEGWNSWDFLHLLEEMGLLPPDALARAVAGQLHANA